MTEKKDYKKMSRQELEEEANLILYGARKNFDIEYPDGRVRPQIINLKGGKTLKFVGEKVYKPVPTIKWKKQKKGTNKKLPVCTECGRSRSPSSGQLCRECYSKNSHKNYREKKYRIEIRNEEISDAMSMVCVWAEIETGIDGFIDSDKHGTSAKKTIITPPDFAEQVKFRSEIE